MKEAIAPGKVSSRQRNGQRNRTTTAVRLVFLLLLAATLAGGWFWWQQDRFQTIAVYPADSATAVATSARLIFHFNQPIPPEIPPDALTLSPAVSGQLSSRDNVLIFSPDAPLQANTRYSVRLNSSVQAANGQSLPWSQTWRFQTGGPRAAFLENNRSEARQLTVLNLDTNTISTLTPPDSHTASFNLSPDGSRLAYILETGVESGIWLATLDGQQEINLLTCSPDRCRRPIWHPDGRRLLYERIPDGSQTPTLWWLDTETGDTLPALDTYPEPSYNARFSSNGRWLSFVAGPEAGIWLYNFDTGTRRNLATTAGTPAVWAPDGRSLLYRDRFVDVLHGSEDDDHLSHSHAYIQSTVLFRYDLDGSVVRLSDGSGLNDDDAAWSPDGEWIAFTRARSRVFMPGQLWLMRADGSDARALTADFDYQHGPPQWSADGRFLLFQRTDTSAPAPQPGIWRYDLQTDTLDQLHPSGILPAWIP